MVQSKKERKASPQREDFSLFFAVAMQGRRQHGISGCLLCTPCAFEVNQINKKYRKFREMSTFGNALAFYQFGCHAHFQTLAFRVRYAVKKALDSGCAEFPFSDFHGGKRRNHHIAHRNIVETDDGDILRDAVAVFAQRAHGSSSDDVIVGEISIGDRRFRLKETQHVAVAIVRGRGNGVYIGMGGAYAVCAECLVIAVGALGEVADVEARMKVAHVFVTALDQITGGVESALDVVNQNAVVIQLVVIAVHHNNRDRKIAELAEIGRRHLGCEKENPLTVHSTERVKLAVDVHRLIK